MAWDNPKDMFTGKAAADLSASMFRAMALTGAANRAVQRATNATHFWGVLQLNVGIGEDAPIARGGVSKMVAGEAITLPAYIAPDSEGRAVKVTASGAVYVGEALLASTAAGDIISVDLERHGQIA